MTLDQIPAGGKVFLDANALIYHFTNESRYGPACTHLVERIDPGDLQGFTSAEVVSDAAHRLMTIEATQQFAWPIAGIASRLR